MDVREPVAHLHQIALTLFEIEPLPVAREGVHGATMRAGGSERGTSGSGLL